MKVLTIVVGSTASDRAVDYSPRSDGYKPGALQTMTRVTIAWSEDRTPTVEEVAEMVWDATNAPSLPENVYPYATRKIHHAMRDARRTIPSLSVGDTVALWADSDYQGAVSCEPFGWGAL